MRLKQSTVLCLRARPLATRPVEIMPKGKGKGGRRGGETKAERARQRALAREIPAINGQHCDVAAPRLRVCGRCRNASYCSVACQRTHWERHRPECSQHRKEMRRLCVLCGRMAADSDPPFPTCYCGERRYCGEACQVRDWFDGTARSRPHSETCASGYLYLEG